ncbi:hypothetical protein CK203_045151 [Vitis vinifera]|uniref:SWIM-type domain-containing protein n=1 Tax=Vitis vinifera TaxID=29760 RepID=A0A438HD17_VITVI|nr:hypothetical protein CK203_045151 [Vitis vinifera]
MDLGNSIYDDYLHEGGEIVPKEDKQIQYKGGQQKGMYIGQGMSYADFVSKACEQLNINSNGYTFHYTLEFDPFALQQLDDDEDMHMMLSHSYDYARIYVLKWTRRVEVEGGIVNVHDYCHNSTEETHNSVASFQANNEFNLGLSQGFMSRCAEIEVRPHDLNVECLSQPSMWGRRCSCHRARFLMGCRPVIAIDSTHLSGLYKDSLFSTTTYDADDGMFPIAFGVVFNMKIYEDVNLRERTCTCKAWKMIGIPCEHACAAIRQMKQDVYEYVDSYFKLPMQELIYSGHFNSIPNHNMPIVDVDGCVRDAQGRLYPSLKPPCSKRPPGRP